MLKNIGWGKIRQRGIKYISRRVITHFLDRPSALALDIASACNIRCKICTLAKWGRQGYMSLDVLEALSEVLYRVPSISLSCTGEPLVHPQFAQILQRVRQLAPNASISFHTNGMLLDKVIDVLIENRLDNLIVSIDGTNQESFGQIRKGAVLSKVLDNIRLMQKIKRNEGVQSPSLAVRSVSMKSNIKELPGIVKMVKELGGERLYVENLDPYSKELAREILYGKELREETEDIFHEVRNTAYKHGIYIELPGLSPNKRKFCIATVPVIAWDGTVKPCLMRTYTRPSWYSGQELKWEELNFGNIMTDNFWKIWRLPEYRAFRKTVRKRNFSGMCRDCLAGTGMLVAMK